MDYTYYSSTSTTDSILSGIGTGTMVMSLIVALFSIVTMWMIFKKAGQPGWAVIIPIYNLVVLFRVIKLDWWHILIFLFVPFAAVVYAIIIPLKLAKVFGKSTAFGVLSIFFSIITNAILAFGSDEYQG